MMAPRYLFGRPRAGFYTCNSPSQVCIPPPISPPFKEKSIMKITELLLAELDREANGIRKTLERVPEGKNSWKPHDKSMPLGNLATIVATIPAWLDMVVNLDELDINPAGGP